MVADILPPLEAIGTVAACDVERNGDSGPRGDSLYAGANALHHSASQFTSTMVPELDQMIERALTATDVYEVERLVGEMHRFLYDNAHNITIGEIHTNYAANKKVMVWNLGRNLYDNNLRSVIRR